MNAALQETRLEESYTACVALTKRTAKNFYYSFHGLPPDKFRAMCVLYAFMRVSDDLGDSAEIPVDDRRRNLEEWRGSFDAAIAGDRSRHPILPAVDDIIRSYRISPRLFHAVIDGIAMDLDFAGFETFDDLAGYCYHVAGAVGQCCIHIWGFRDDRALNTAVDCGLALQLTNILRDLGTDADMQRIYIPREDLRRFAYTADDIRSHCRDDRYRRLMQYEVERTRDYYRKAESLFDDLEPAGRPILRAMLRIYGGLLNEIERRDYDVFSRPVALPTWRKVLIAADAALRRTWQRRQE